MTARWSGTREHRPPGVVADLHLAHPVLLKSVAGSAMKPRASSMFVLDELLQRWIPGHVAGSTTVRVSAVGAGVERPVAVIGIGKQLLQVVRATEPELAFAAEERIVLRFELCEDATRIDVPVEVAASGPVAMVLRIAATPVVLRRRVIRDRNLEEALDVRVPPLVA